MVSFQQANFQQFLLYHFGKKEGTISMAIGNVELKHASFTQHSRIVTAKMK